MCISIRRHIRKVLQAHDTTVLNGCCIVLQGELYKAYFEATYVWNKICPILNSQGRKAECASWKFVKKNLYLYLKQIVDNRSFWKTEVLVLTVS